MPKDDQKSDDQKQDPPKVDQKADETKSDPAITALLTREGQTPDAAVIEPTPVPAPLLPAGQWPRTMHHPVHGAKVFADPNQYAAEGGGFLYEHERHAEFARTPLEAEIVRKRFLDRQEQAIIDGHRSAAGNAAI